MTSIKELIETMRDMGVEMTPKEVSVAMDACHEAEEYSIDVTEMGRICLFFAQIGKAREAEDLDVEKFDLLMGVLDFLVEENSDDT